MKIDLVDELSTTEAVPMSEVVPSVTYALNFTALAVVHKYLADDEKAPLKVAVAFAVVW